MTAAQMQGPLSCTTCRVFPAMVVTIGNTHFAHPYTDNQPELITCRDLVNTSKIHKSHSTMDTVGIDWTWHETYLFYFRHMMMTIIIIYSRRTSILTFTLVVRHVVPAVTVTNGWSIDIFTVRVITTVWCVQTFIDIFITVSSCPPWMSSAWCTADDIITLMVFTVTGIVAVQTPLSTRTLWCNNNNKISRSHNTTFALPSRDQWTNWATLSSLMTAQTFIIHIRI